MEAVTIQKIHKLAPAFSEEQILVIQNTIAKGTTAAELGLFLFTASTVGLNPLNKEIYCYKDSKKNLIIFTGRDGLLRKAQENPRFAGIRSCEIRQGDPDWVVDVPHGVVKHQITKAKKERGEIIGAYCFVWRSDGEPTLEWVDFDTYNKGSNVWQSDPVAMIRKVAEAHALKKAFGLAGVQLEEDWEIRDNIAVPISPEKGVEKEDPLAEKTLELVEALEHYQGEDIDEIRDRCAFARSRGELTVDFINGVLKEIGALRDETSPQGEPEPETATTIPPEPEPLPAGRKMDPGAQAELNLGGEKGGQP